MIDAQIQLLQNVTLDRMRNTNETDDINSILKSPCIKARKKRRKRSSWASGVIKKAKRASTPRNGTDNENTENAKSDEEEQVR